jgi:2-polyprenyl-3-methyl-5-hydroxy-6-metoxy-1,4-benzoquinol methylase
LNQAPKTYTISRCRSCGLRWISPYPTPDDYQTIYDHNYYESVQHGGFSYRDEKQELAPCYKSIAYRFRSANITHKLLDIGCGTGDFLIAAKESGICGEGIEPSEYAAQKASETGFPIFHGTLSDLPPDVGPYAAAFCSHVLEHVPNVNTFVEELKTILEPSALLYIEVPNQFNSILDTVNRLRHQHCSYTDYSIHHHYFFTPKALRLVLESHGFEVLSLTTFLPCRRASREPGIRKWVLQLLLWLADQFAQRGDVISVWACRKQQ